MKTAKNLNSFSEKEQKILNEFKFPDYTYYKDPKYSLQVGCKEEGIVCACCGKRSQVYFECAAAYGPLTLDEYNVCPDCVKSGEAADKIDASFVMYDARWPHGEDEPVTDKEKLRELLNCTPPQATWQEMDWRAHCGDFAVYLGQHSWSDLKKLGKQAIKETLADLNVDCDEPVKKRHLKAWDKEEATPLHLFQCRKCGKYMGMLDFD